MVESRETEIQRVGVCGAGTMGAGIAIVAARAGFETVLFDLEQASAERAIDQTRQFFAKSVQRGKLEQLAMDASLSRLTPTQQMGDLSECDIVIEAVFEDLQVKRTLFKALNQICPARTLFASNTSTLSITEIAADCGREDRVVGMHFCLPAQLMKLVEMSAGLNTDEAMFQLAWKFCQSLGQIPTRTLDSPGFILNYFLVPFNNDVIRMIEAGVSTPADIDRALKAGMGYKMGPCELLDLIGLDTQVLLCEAFFDVTHDPRAAAPPLLRRMVAAGRLGRKSGRGFYDYDSNAMFGS